MSYRKIVFANNEIYHIFNRSIAKEEIFFDKYHLRQILGLIEFYSYPEDTKYSEFKKLSTQSRQNYMKNVKKRKPLVYIYSFAIMPTHFHLLLKQVSDRGVVKFTSNIQNSYAKYFNKKEERDGSVFKRPFKATHIDSDEIFLHVLRYIHLNPVTSYLISFNDLNNYQANSYCHYVSCYKKTFIQTKLALGMIGGLENLTRFTADQEDYQKKLSLVNKICEEQGMK